MKTRLKPEDRGRNQLRKEAVNTFTTAVFLRNCDRARYGTLIDDLSRTYALGVDQYPRTLQGAVDVLRKVKVDRKEKKKKDNHNGSSGSQNGESRRDTSFAQQRSERRCFVCGDKQHIVPQCPVKGSVPRDDWYDRTGREHNHHQVASQSTGQDDEQGDDETDNASVRSEMSTGWSAHQRSFHDKPDANDVKNMDKILLDTGTTTSVFGNEDMVVNLRKSEKPIYLVTNMGDGIVDTSRDSVHACPDSATPAAAAHQPAWPLPAVAMHQASYRLFKPSIPRIIRII